MTIFAKYSYPENGTRFERLEVSKLLNVGRYYLVDQIEVGNSYASIKLTNFDYIFNSIFFDFFNSEGEKIDIYKNPLYNYYIREKEKEGDEVNG